MKNPACAFLIHPSSFCLCLLSGAVLIGCLGGTWFQLRHWRNGLTLFEHTLAVTRGNFVAHGNLGTALFELGRVEEAIEQYALALRLRPDYADAHNNLGAALSQQDQLPEAMAHYREALRLKPDYVEARLNVGMALFQQGRAAEAIQHLQQALRFKPDHAEAHHCLARVLATSGDASVRDGARAVIHAEQALRLSGGNDARILGMLAAAYAEAGRFGDAVRTAEAAMDLASAAGQAAPARQIQERLLLYQAGRPYHEGSTPAP